MINFIDNNGNTNGVYPEENDESNDIYDLISPYNSYEGDGNGNYDTDDIIFKIMMTITI